MKAPPVIGRNPGRWLLLAAIVITAAIAVLFAYNPAQNGFYPRCFFKMSTGLDCAGCGGLRATHQLLNGNFSAAFRLNPLLFLALPVAAVLLVNVLLEQGGRPKLVPAPVVRALLWLLLLVAVVYSVWRNMPGM